MTAVAGPAGYDPRRRIGVMIGVFALLIVALVVQLLRVQILDRDRYVSWGEDQRLTTTELPDHARVELGSDNGVVIPDCSGLRLEFTPVLTESATARKRSQSSANHRGPGAT